MTVCAGCQRGIGPDEPSVVAVELIHEQDFGGDVFEGHVALAGHRHVVVLGQLLAEAHFSEHRPSFTDEAAFVRMRR